LKYSKAAAARIRKNKAAARKAVRGRRRTIREKVAALNAVDLAAIRTKLAHRCGYLDKNEVLAIVGCSYPSLWKWQRAGKFPVAKIMLGKSKWEAATVAAWLDGLPTRHVKPLAAAEQTTSIEDDLKKEAASA